jgi:hypothetical protein
MPAGATPNVLADLDADTTRLLWTDAGVSYYAVLSGEGDQYLVIVDDLEAVSGCSSNLPITVQGSGGAKMMLADNLPDDSADVERFPLRACVSARSGIDIRRYGLRRSQPCRSGDVRL